MQLVSNGNHIEKCINNERAQALVVEKAYKGINNLYPVSLYDLNVDGDLGEIVAHVGLIKGFPTLSGEGMNWIWDTSTTEIDSLRGKGFMRNSKRSAIMGAFNRAARAIWYTT